MKTNTIIFGLVLFFFILALSGFARNLITNEQDLNLVTRPIVPLILGWILLFIQMQRNKL